MPYLHREDREQLPRKAASAINADTAVRSSASTAEEILPCASTNHRVLGVAQATCASPGDWTSVQTEGVAIMRACASIGPGGLVAVGSSNGRLAVAASGAFIVGEAVGGAVDADFFSVLLRPNANVVAG